MSRNTPISISSEKHTRSSDGEGELSSKMPKQSRLNERLTEKLSSVNEISGVQVSQITGHDSQYQVSQNVTELDARYAIMSLWLSLSQSRYPYRISLVLPDAWKSDIDKAQWHVRPRVWDSYLILLELEGRLLLLACELQPPEANGDVPLRIVLLAGRLHGLRHIPRAVFNALLSNPQFLPQSFEMIKWPVAIEDWGICPADEPLDRSIELCHIIANAWAYMLDIPVKRGTRKEVLAAQGHEFYDDLRIVIENAFLGRADYEYMENFLCNSGYALRPGSEDCLESLLCLNTTTTSGRKYRRRLRRVRTIQIGKEGVKLEVGTHDLEPPAGQPRLWDARLEQIREKWTATQQQAGSTTLAGLVSASPRSTTAEPGARTITASTWHEYLEKKILMWDQVAQQRLQGSSQVEREELQRILIGEVLDKRTRLAAPLELESDQVVYAIGAFWQQRWEERDHRIAFVNQHTADVLKRDYQVAPATHGAIGTMAVGALPTSTKLLIPVHFSSDEYEKRGAVDVDRIGHFVLIEAEAKSNSRGKGRKVELKIYDSMPGYVARGLVLKQARSIVRNCGWLGWVAKKHQQNEYRWETQADFGKMEAPTVPRQTDAKACGYIVVLTAWCIILGLPLIKSEQRRNMSVELRLGKTTKGFGGTLRIMLNLAMQGCLDENDVVAFTQVFGYAENEEEFGTYELKERPLRAKRTSQSSYREWTRTEQETIQIVEQRRTSLSPAAGGFP